MPLWKTEMQWFCGPQQETARISKYVEHFVVSFWTLTERTKRYQLIATTYINFATQKQTSSNENFERKSLSKRNCCNCGAKTQLKVSDYN